MLKLYPEDKPVFSLEFLTKEIEEDDEKEANKKVEEKAKTLIERIKTSLGDRVKDVKVTHRLTDLLTDSLLVSQ